MAIGTILGLAGSVLGSTLAARSQKKANEKNLELARLQNQWNIEQWQRENDYNTPRNQMARLRDAGVNPNLAYANGAPVNVAAHSHSNKSSIKSLLSLCQAGRTPC